MSMLSTAQATVLLAAWPHILLPLQAHRAESDIDNVDIESIIPAQN